ncbi:M23 family metallopeptidase [Gryllotalpicola daejeonensis]
MLLAKSAACLALVVALALAPGRAVATEGFDGPNPPAPADAPRWRWPTSPPGPVVQPFEAPPGPYAAGHRGIDLAASPGEPVLAPADATIHFAGVVVDRPVVTLAVGDSVLVSFEPVATAASTGSELHAGEAFGTVAHGGHCDDRCIHVGVRVDGEYVSPLLFYAGIPPAVLLPLD